ncbi:kinase kinase kinase [Aureococcus anophagefferens]|nr:kinase kinase kinase [Aureococcus anophagefferens]
MLALTLALAAGFRTQSLRAAPRRSSALSASKRVAVCGPSGGTVADGIAARLAAGGAEVVRVVDGEGRSGRVDAAVCCGDGSDDVALSKLLDAVPGFDKGFSDPAAVATKALGGAARTACVVLHGPLFGGVALEGELQAFKSGLLKEPVLEDDFGRRGARVAVVRDGAKGEDQMFSSARGLGLGDMAAATERGQMREAQGVAAKPLAATRRGAVADAVAGKSTKALASRLDARYDWAPEPLSSWLCGEWGPTALRSVDATLAIRGARPVAFVAPADPSSGQLGALRWETLTNAGVEADGRLEFALVAAGGGLDLVATRDRVDELTGEADLMDLLVDALGNCLVGRSANFKVERTTSDDFADLLGPWFAPGVGAVLLLAAGGFLAAFDALVRVDLERDIHGLQNVLDEARHLQALRHDHIVAYYDTFVHREDGSNGLFSLDLRGGAVADYACIAMEDCAGGSLLDHVASGVPFPLPAVVEVTRQCATGLAYAHAQGVVHRDIKLENVFVLRGTIKIGDFGLAVAAAAGPARSDAARTLSTRRRLGPRRRRHRVYQPPECFADGDADGDDAAGRRRRRAPRASAARRRRHGLLRHEVATPASLPNEPPFLGMLLLEDDADRHAAAIAGRFAASKASALGYRPSPPPTGTPAVDLDGPDPLVQARAPGRLAAHAQRDVDLRVAPQAAVVAHPAVALEHDAGDDEPEVRDAGASTATASKSAATRSFGRTSRRSVAPAGVATRTWKAGPAASSDAAGGGDGAPDVGRPHCAAAGAASRGAAAESSRLFGDRGMGRPGRCAAQKWRPALST